MPPAQDLEPVVVDATVEETTEHTIEIYLDLDDRVIQRMVVGTWKQVVDFSLTQQTRVDGTWHDVIRFDCAHGTVHSHTFSAGGGDTKQEIADLDDLDDSCDAVLGKLYDGWEERRRRYRHG